MNDTFLNATKQKLRFTTNRGALTVEDLWDLSLKDLDRIAVAIDSQINTNTKSFLDNPSKKGDLQELQLDVLKEIIRVKQDENKATLEANAKRRQKEFLTELLQKKKIGEMEAMTTEQIEAELKALEA